MDRQAWCTRVFGILLAGTPLATAQEDAVNIIRIPAAVEPDAVNIVNIPEAAAMEPTVVAYRDYHDPWEGFNRRIFAFNDVTYRYALIPLSKGYLEVVPQPVRSGVGRVFSNLREPLNAINHGLQGEFRYSGRNLLRFVTNSTVGVLGIFDPATHWLGIDPRRSTLNDTLSRHDVGAGPYLVFPLLGPTDLRGGMARSVETLVHPLRFLLPEPEATLSIAFDNFQAYAPVADVYPDLRERTSDPYVYFRNQYLQGRERNEDFGDGQD